MDRAFDDRTWSAELNSVPGKPISSLGLRSQRGDTRRFKVCRTALQMAVFSEVSISTLCHLDGSIYPCPEGMEDDVLDVQFRSKRLTGLPIDVLVERALKLSINESPAEARAQLATMRVRLLRALSAVEDEIGRAASTSTERLPALQ